MKVTIDTDEAIQWAFIQGGFEIGAKSGVKASDVCHRALFDAAKKWIEENPFAVSVRGVEHRSRCLVASIRVAFDAGKRYMTGVLEGRKAQMRQDQADTVVELGDADYPVQATKKGDAWFTRAPKCGWEFVRDWTRCSQEKAEEYEANYGHLFGSAV